MTQRKDNYSWVYIALAVLIGVAILYAIFSSSSSSSGYVSIKYRDDKVNVSASNFEPLDKSDSTVKGAWYDSGNEYMVIKLGSIYYHYCGMPSNVWSGFKSSASLDEYYQQDIKGNFDCREHPVPSY